MILSSKAVRGVLVMVVLAAMCGVLAYRDSQEVDAFDAPTEGSVLNTPPFLGETNAMSVRFADVDNDGDDDVITATYDSGTVRLNDGSGNFGPWIAFGSGDDIMNIETANIDDDENLDIVATGDDGEANVYLGNGDGTFSDSVEFLGTNADDGADIAFGDFNGDDNQDMVISSHPTSSTVNAAPQVFLGDGTGQFDAGTDLDTSVIGVGGEYFQAKVGLLNGDAFLDIAVATGTNGVGVFLGNGDGTFQTGTVVSGLANTTALEIAELTGDANNDLVIGSGNSFGDEESIAVLPGVGDGTFGLSTFTFPVGHVNDLLVYDADGLGGLDVVGVSGGSIMSVFRLSNDGSGNLAFEGASQVPSSNNSGNLSGRYIDVANVDDSGLLDVAVNVGALGFDADKGVLEGVMILPGDGTRAFDAVDQYLLGNQSTSSFADVYNTAIGDFNSDGFNDVVAGVCDGNGDRSLDVLLSTSAPGVFEPAEHYIPNTACPRSMAVANFDGENGQDIVLLGANEGASHSGVFFNDGTGGFTNFLTISGVGNADVVVGDFNEDGFPDFAHDLIVNQFVPSVNVIRVYLNDGSGAFTTSDLAAGDLISGLLVEDYDDDQNLDLLFTRISNPDVSVFFGNGDGTFGARTTVADLTGESFATGGIAQGQINGDGNLDIAVALSSGIRILQGNGEGVFINDSGFDIARPNLSTGLEDFSSVRTIALDDIDGDGKTDLATGARNEPLVIYTGNGDFTFDTPNEHRFSTGSHSYVQIASLGDENGLSVITTNAGRQLNVFRHNNLVSSAGANTGGPVQSGYRFFNDEPDTADVGTPLADIDTPATLTSSQQSFRLRLLLRADGRELNEFNEPAYLLHISEQGGDGLCDAAGVGESYAALQNEFGDIQFDNSTDIDDGTLFIPNTNDPFHAGVGVFRQTYNDAGIFDQFGGGAFFSAMAERVMMAFGLNGDIEADPTFEILQSTHIPQGSEGMWDFLLKDVSAPANTTYCIKVTDENDADITGYEQIAEFTTAGTTFTQSAYRWYDAADNIDPSGTPLAAQDTPITLASSGDSVRLRTLAHVDNLAASGAFSSLTLQFAEQGVDGQCDAEASGETYEDLVTGSGAFQYDDEASLTDEDTISSTAEDPTHGGDSVIPQTYNEAGDDILAIPTEINVGEDGMWDIAIQDVSATAETTYCFRLADASGNAIADYEQIAELTTAAAGGGGGGGNACIFTPGRVLLNNGAALTDDKHIRVTLDQSSATAIALSEDPEMVGVKAQDVTDNLQFTLSEGEGEKNVYYQLSNGCFQSPVFSLSIRLVPAEEDLSPDDGDPAAAHIEEGAPGSRTNPSHVLTAGTYVRTPDDTTVYYIDTDLHRHAVLDSRSFFTHEDSFGVVIYVTDDTIIRAETDDVVVPLPGRVLVTFWDSPDVFAILPNQKNTYRPILRKVDSEEAATALFGEDWKDSVIDFNPAFHALFEDGVPLTSTEQVGRETLVKRNALSEKAGLIKIEALPGLKRSISDSIVEFFKRRK